MKKYNLDNLVELGKVEEMGIDDNGKKTYKQKEYSKWITPTRLQLPNGKVATLDPNEFSCELYNPNKFTVILENIHYNPEERVKMQYIKVESEGFALLPHKYYIPWINHIGNDTGEKFTMLENYGDKKFIGNKKASSPTIRKKLF